MSYFGTDPIEIAFNVLVHIIGIFAFILIIKLLAKNNSPSMASWRILFYAFVVFVIKKIVVGLSGTGIIYIPSTLFNVIIISMFIYALLTEIDARKSTATTDDIDRINKSIKKLNTKL